MVVKDLKLGTVPQDFLSHYELPTGLEFMDFFANQMQTIQKPLLPYSSAK